MSAAVQGQYIQYGSAYLYVNPNGGNLGANPMPVFPLTVQDVEVSVKGKLDELRGQMQWPDDTALGDKTGTGKFGIGRKDWYLFQQLYNADVVAPGGNSVSPLEQHTVPASSTFVITVVPPSTGTFVEDLGVLYSATGLRLQKVVSLTAVGQYTVSSGVYTFYSGDASALVTISYLYSVTTGNTYQVNNQIMGYGPQAEFFLVDRYQLGANGVSNCLWLNAVKVTSLGNIGNKRDKYAMPEIEFTIFADPAGRVMRPFVANG